MPARRFVSVLVVAALACERFDAEDRPRTATPDGTPDGGTANPQDGAVTTPSNGIAPACPASTTGSKFTTMTSAIVAKPPADYDYPFQIVTDETYVYWVSQSGTAGAEQGKAYNGVSPKGYVHRADKRGSGIDSANTVLAGDQPRVVALAIDGDFLYWAVESTTPGVAAIRRMRRDCMPGEGTCTPEEITTVGAPAPIMRLERARPNLIYMLTGNGTLYALDTERRSATPLGQSGDFPGITVTGETAFVSSAKKSSVFVTGPNGPLTVHANTPSLNAGDPGGSFLATDCASLFVYYGAAQQIYFTSITTPGPYFEKFSDHKQADIYDMTANRDFVFLASANSLGLSAISIATHEKVGFAPGSYWGITVDDYALFAGDHDKNAPGTIRRFID